MSNDPWKKAVSGQQRHTLDWYCARLKAYLKPGITVLDVGCGPGTLTEGIAEAVAPGEVMGIDGSDAMIAEAEKLRDRSKLSNVTFKKCDAHTLEFDNDTFDVTFCSSVLEWLENKVLALQEQRRVTKPGGLVIEWVCDFGTAIRYPACPSYTKYGFALYSSRGLDIFIGRRMHELLYEAGFGEIDIQGFVPSYGCRYPGHPDFESLYGWAKKSLDDALKAIDDDTYEPVKTGVLNRETVEKAVEEMEAWHSHPHAFVLQSGVFAVGKV